MQRSRTRNGSICQDKRDKVYRFYWWETGKRRSQKLGKFASKTAAIQAAEKLREDLRKTRPPDSVVPSVADLIAGYRAEKMPKRYSSQRSYDVWFRLYVEPRWGKSPITYLQARPVERWLLSLDLAPRSRSSVRFLIGLLWDFAMWRGDVPTARNPMSLVTIPGASKRTRKPRSLNVAEFHKLLGHMEDPFRTMAQVCVCFGLRISEALGLKWSDIDWLNSTLRIQRGIVRQRVDETKTEYSERAMPIDAEMLEVFKTWRTVNPIQGGGRLGVCLASPDWPSSLLCR
jgi:integrase